MKNPLRTVVAVAVCTCLISVMNMNLAQNPESPALRHVVLFKFKADAGEAAVAKVVDEFRALPKKIDVIKSFEYGTNNSPEGLNKGLTHCFFLTFTSEKDRDTYLKHAEHEAFVNVLKPILDDATVVDYWAKQ